VQPEILHQNSPYVFDLDSEMWRINHQRCGLFFGPAAAILQIAHPRIAQGVAEHSDFRNDTLGRLRRTLSSTNGIAFGTLAEAEAIRDRLHHVHGQVRGDTVAGVGGRANYSAFEPDLLLWVLATLVMASLQGWEMIYGPLAIDRREQFYRDMRRFGGYFGLRPEHCPTGWTEFAEYYQSMIHGPELASHPFCAEVCRHIVTPRSPFGMRMLGTGLHFLSIETLPKHLHAGLGLRSTLTSRTQMALLKKTAPLWFPRLPERQRLYPEAILRLQR